MIYWWCKIFQHCQYILIKFYIIWNGWNSNIKNKNKNFNWNAPTVYKNFTLSINYKY